MFSIRSIVPLHVVFLVLAMISSAVTAGEVDLLIDKLVSKGLLSQSDADEIAAELIRETSTAASTPITSHSNWTDRIALKGDLRVRHQSEELKNAPSAGNLGIDERDRWRIRWRAGVVANVNERWEVGFGLASGGTDARSTNQTLRGAFSTGDARLDYAYAKYQASEQADLFAGKFKNPLWTPKDLLWDSDIRTEGLALPMRFTLGDRIETFVTPAYLVLSEEAAFEQRPPGVLSHSDGATRDNIAMWILQAGATFELTETVSLKLAPAYYDFVNLKDSPGPLRPNISSNSRNNDGLLIYDYNAVALGGQLNISGIERVPKLSLFGEWVNNFDADESGWLAGFTFGDSKIGGVGDWQLTYNYRRLERDAWPEFLADSDPFLGPTNVKGNEIEFVWGLATGVSLSLDYYGGVEYLGTDIAQDLLQMDLNVKW
jgi:polyhydroxyalkanoate synthesis regulator phasin